MSGFHGRIASSAQFRLARVNPHYFRLTGVLYLPCEGPVLVEQLCLFQAVVVNEFPCLRERNLRCIRVEWIDEVVDLLGDDRRRYDQNGRGHALQPLIPEVQAHHSAGLTIPAHMKSRIEDRRL